MRGTFLFIDLDGGLHGCPLCDKLLSFILCLMHFYCVSYILTRGFLLCVLYFNFSLYFNEIRALGVG